MNSGRTIFSQVMDFLPMREFRQCVARYRGHYKVSAPREPVDSASIRRYFLNLRGAVLLAYTGAHLRAYFQAVFSAAQHPPNVY